MRKKPLDKRGMYTGEKVKDFIARIEAKRKKLADKKHESNK